MDSKDREKISVIIPVYNDPQGLRITLQSVLAQTYDNYEVIVVDNGSTDNTKSVADNLTDNHTHLFVYTETDIQGSYAARNKGIKESDGEILCFIDADMSVPVDWLENIYSNFEHEEILYSGCEVKVFIPDRKNTYAAKYNVTTGFPVERYLRRNNFAPTCCLSVRKGVFDLVGLFDERLKSGGDWELGNRVHDAGIEQHYNPNVVVRHPARTRLMSLVNKHKRVGTGKQQLKELGLADYNSVFHPINVFPPHPITYKKRVADSSQLSSTESIIFYLITYLLKISDLAGRLSVKF